MSVPAMVLALALLAAQAQGVVEVRDVAAEQYPRVSAVVRVLDGRGRAVPGLSASDFTVTEDGRPVDGLDVRASFRDGGSVAVALLLDTSFSMRGAALDAAKDAARAFLDRLGPEDRVGLITFGLPPVEQAPFGPPSAIGSLDSLVAAGYTGLYDALNLGVAGLSAQTAKARAVIVLTDGADDGSAISFAAIRQVVTRAGLPVHAVGFASPEFDAAPLRDLTALSRGSYRETTDARELVGLYRELASELVAEYRISYQSSAPPGVHQLEIRARAGELQAGAERPFEVIGGATPATIAEPEDDDSFPVWPVLAACGVVVLAVMAATVVRARRDRARPLVVAADRSLSVPAARTGLVLEGSGVTIPLGNGAVLVGRDPAAQVIIDDPTVSRHHARLHLSPEGLWVEDLGSSNGTLVNGVRVDRQLMRSGDALDIGTLHLVLRGDQP